MGKILLRWINLGKRMKKASNLKKAVTTFFILLILWIFGFYLYVTYKNIEIDNSNYTAEKTVSTIREENVESATKESKSVADVIEDVTRMCGRYFKT